MLKKAIKWNKKVISVRKKLLNEQKWKVRAQSYAVYMYERNKKELLTGFEPVTSSLPRMRSTDWATAAYMWTRLLLFSVALMSPCSRHNRYITTKVFIWQVLFYKMFEKMKQFFCVDTLGFSCYIYQRSDTGFVGSVCDIGVWLSLARALP